MEWPRRGEGSSPAAPAAADPEVARFWALLHALVPRARATQVLIAANVAVFVALVATGASPLSPDTETMLRWGANFAPLTASGEWWRLGAAAFLHHGIIHLAFNMWVLWDVGRLTERLFGSVPYLFLYLAAGLSGSIASVLWHPGGAVSVGASGAVFGVIGALFGFLVTERRSIPGPVLAHLKRSVLFFLVCAISIGLVYPAIDNAAHLGGLGCGFLLGAILARPLAAPDRARRVARRFSGAVLVAAALLGFLGWLVPPPAYDFAMEQRMREEVARFARDEDAILSAWKRIAEQRKAGAIGDAEMAERLQTEAVEPWQAAAERLAKIRLSQGSPSQERFALLLRYAELRRDSARLIAEGLREQDRAKMERARALQEDMDGVRRRLENLAAPDGS
jgi:rhomboid protease GluP